MRFEYNYGGNGLLQKRLDFVDESFFPTATRTYSYDDYGNVVGIQHETEDGKVSWLEMTYVLDEFNRWTQATVSMPQGRIAAGMIYGGITKDRSICKPLNIKYDVILERQIRYNGDKRPLESFLESSSPKNTGLSQERGTNPEWILNVAGLDKTIGSTAVMINGAGKSCLGVEGEKQDYSRLIAVATGSIYSFVNREQIETLFEEQKLSLVGLVAKEKGIKAGELAGAQKALILDLGCLEMKNLIELQCVDVETSLVDWSIVGVQVSFDEFLREFMQILYGSH